MDAHLTLDQLKTLLDDTQESLAAAFARIEAYRIQNRQIRAELSQLRQQVHGPHEQQPVTSPTLNKSQSSGDLRSSRAPSINFPQERDAFTALNSGPLYVAKLEGNVPVNIVSGGKKVPANIVLSKDYVDFVEVRARIQQSEFVGITTLKGAKQQRPVGSGMLLCCFAPPQVDHGDADGQLTRATGTQETGEAGPSTSGQGTWQIIWNSNGAPQRLIFDASQETRKTLHRHTEKWLGVTTADDTEDLPADPEGTEELAVPRPLSYTEVPLQLVGEPSCILDTNHVAALSSAIPPLERMRTWSCSYSTAKHGISLGTLYRRMVHGQPSILLVRDSAGYIFGGYTPDSWRVAPRFYGSGETFVFQLEPHRVMYPWRSLAQLKNDFFMYATPECIALGGLGHFAIHLDSELLHGSSGTCGTFGSPCLAFKEEFRIMVVEVWQVAP